MKRSFLHTILRTQPGEGQRLGLLLLYSAAFSGGVVTVGYRGVASALFISRLPADAIPYLFILPAIAITLVLLLYSRIAARSRSSLLVPISTVLMLVLSLVFRALLETEYGNSFEVLASLYLFGEGIVSVIGIQIWVIAGQVFDARQARRLFPLIAGAGTITSIAAGLLLGTLADALGVNNLLFVLALALALCALSAAALGRLQTKSAKGMPGIAPAKDTSASEAPRYFMQTLRTIWRMPLLRAIGVLLLFLSLLINIGGYQFFRALNLNFASEDQALIAFFGTFEVWTGLFALAVQFVISPLIIRRFGLFVALLFLPVATLVTSSAALTGGGALLWIALIGAIDPVFRWTINDTAMNLLYLPVPAGLRQRAKELFGVLYALTFGLLGVLFLLNQTNEVSSFLYWAIPAIVVALLWIGLTPWARRQYLRRMAENVAQRRFDLRGAPLNIMDADSVRVLADALHDADDLRVLHAMQLIADAPGADWDAHVAPLLAHPSPDLQVSAIRFLGKPGNQAYEGAIIGLFNAASESVRAAAIEAYCAIAGSSAVDRVGPYLEGSEANSSTMQGAAVRGLLRYGGMQGASQAIAVLLRMSHSPDSQSRKEAARLLTGAIGENLHPLATLLMDDPDPEVRVAAVQAAGATGIAEMIPLVLAKLGDKQVSAAASTALAGYGVKALSNLEILISNPDADVTARVQAAKLLAHIDSPKVAHILLGHLQEKSAAVRTTVLRALADIACRKPLQSLPEAQLDAQAMRDLQVAYKLYMMRAVLGEAEPGSLLGDALTTRIEGALDNVFYLLTIRYGAGIRQTRSAIASTDTGRRAQAIELLDNTLTTPVRERLIPFIEAPTIQVIETAQKRFGLAKRPPTDLLADLAAGSDDWLRMCGIWQSTRFSSSSHETNKAAWLSSAQTSGDINFMAISTVERVLILKKVPLFADISGEGLAPIARLADEVRFSQGATIIKEGEEGDCVYITVHGRTGITRAGLGQVAVRDAPTVLGELALILSQPRSASCVALDDMVALKMDRAPFQELLSQQPDIAKGVIKVLAERLAHAQNP